MLCVCHPQDRSFELGKEKWCALQGTAREKILLAPFSSLLTVRRRILIKRDNIDTCEVTVYSKCYAEVPCHEYSKKKKTKKKKKKKTQYVYVLNTVIFNWIIIISYIVR